MNTTYYIVFGNISTENFGNRFDKMVFDKDIFIQIHVYVPYSMTINFQTTISFDIERVSLNDLGGHDDDKLTILGYGTVDPAIIYFSKNFTRKSQNSYVVVLNRRISKETTKNLKLDQMPGFQLTWKYENQMGLSIRHWNHEFTR